MPGTSRPVIVGLDLLRFAAATAVVLYHLGTASWADSASIAARIVDHHAAFPILFDYTWFGWLGVEIFFVISGLVISYSSDGCNAFDFVRSRAVRLLPAAWICASITFVVALVLQLSPVSQLVRSWIASVTFFPFPPWIDTVYWTLGIEIIFYALVFFLLLFHQFLRLESAALLLGLFSSAYWFLGSYFAPHFLLQHLWGRKLELTLLPYGCYFATGVLAYLISKRGASPIRISAIFVFIAAAMVEINFKTAHSNQILHSGQSPFSPRLVYIVAVLLVFITVTFKSDSSSLTARISRLFGLATYPLYLLHDIVGAAILRQAVDLGLSPILALSLTLVLCVSFSVLIACFAEPPLQSAIRALFVPVRSLASRNQSLTLRFIRPFSSRPSK